MPAHWKGYRALFSWNDDQVTTVSLRTVRWLTIVTFVGYVGSRLLNHGFGDDSFLGGIVGNLLGLVAILSWFLILASRTNRFFLEDERKLDEYGRSRRNGAMHGAYTLLGLAVVLCGAYVQIGVDWNWPMPRDRDVIGDLALSATLVATMLPVTILAWTLDLSEDPEADEDPAAA